MWYFIANKVSGFGTNTSCIKGIKSTYKAKEGFKGRMRRMTEYQEAEREAEKEVNRTGAAPESESGAAEEQSTRRTRQDVLKLPWALLPKVSVARRRQ